MHFFENKEREAKRQRLGETPPTADIQQSFVVDAPIFPTSTSQALLCATPPTQPPQYDGFPSKNFPSVEGPPCQATTFILPSASALGATTPTVHDRTEPSDFDSNGHKEALSVEQENHSLPPPVKPNATKRARKQGGSKTRAARKQSTKNLTVATLKPGQAIDDKLSPNPTTVDERTGTDSPSKTLAPKTPVKRQSRQSCPVHGLTTFESPVPTLCANLQPSKKKASTTFACMQCCALLRTFVTLADKAQLIVEAVDSPIALAACFTSSQERLLSGSARDALYGLAPTSKATEPQSTTNHTKKQLTPPVPQRIRVPCRKGYFQEGGGNSYRPTVPDTRRFTEELRVQLSCSLKHRFLCSEAHLGAPMLSCPICRHQRILMDTGTTLEHDKCFEKRQVELIEIARRKFAATVFRRSAKTDRPRVLPPSLKHSDLSNTITSGSKIAYSLDDGAESLTALQQLARRDATLYAGVTEEHALPVIQILTHRHSGPWNILQLPAPRGNTSSQLYVEAKASYRALARKVHPDKNPHPKAKEVFFLLDQAWRTICERAPDALLSSKADPT